MNIRWYLFWIKDFLTGSKVRKNYNDIKKNYYNFSKDEQQVKIDNLLKYAKINCSYYKNNILKIDEFPVVNKSIIKDNFNKIIVKNYNVNKLHKMSTSGSTGTPFTVYQNREKRNRVIAEVLFFGKIGNYLFGEKQMFLRVWVSSIKKSFFKRKLQNMITYDISNLDNDNIKNILDLLDRSNVKCILGYASSLTAIANYINKKSYTYNNNKLKSIFSGSELLLESTRETLSKTFHCKVYSRYANEENGLLGQDVGTNEYFWLNEADYYFEFLKIDSDKPAKPGELSRIVITDLYNYSMPLIRYDTGDLAIFDYDGDKKIIKTIYGRKVDLIYDTNGKALSPHLITNNMWEFEEIKQFKFIQLNKNKYKIILNVEKNFVRETHLINKFKSLLGKDSNIDIEYTKEIPVLSSGKRKYIENVWK